jgi:hypothetical protein
MACHVRSKLKRRNVFGDIVASQKKALCLEQHVEVRPLLRMMPAFESSAIEAKKFETLRRRKVRRGGFLQIGIPRIEIELREINEIRTGNIFDCQAARDRASKVPNEHLALSSRIGSQTRRVFPSVVYKINGDIRLDVAEFIYSKKATNGSRGWIII